MSIVKVGSLEWPAGGAQKATKPISTAGPIAVHHAAAKEGISAYREPVVVIKDDDDADEGANGKSKKPPIDLLNISSKKLAKLTYYHVLGNLSFRATSAQVKKAYHKACLVYHPDKTGRGEDDEVFMKIKSGFETLMDRDKRRAYDSQMPFDDSIPKGGESGAEFYAIYGPVFERNLRFDERLDPDRKPPTANNNNNNNNAGGKKKKNNKKKKQQPPKGPPEPPKAPSFGDSETSLDDVHVFYDYWTHFESWRDFSMQAAKETNNANFDAANVDSRYEKRSIQKEINRKAKNLKQKEVVRISTLVERAMAADPRLKREKLRIVAEKERIERERKEQEETKAREEKERAEKEQKETAEREAIEKTTKQNAKAIKDKEKKILRKAKATLRKLCLAAHATEKSFWTNMDTMGDDIELLCEQLDAVELGKLSASMGGLEAVEKPNLDGLDVVQTKILTLQKKSQEEIDAAVKAAQGKRA